jgi:hypothetical protein
MFKGNNFSNIAGSIFAKLPPEIYSKSVDEKMQLSSTTK